MAKTTAKESNNPTRSIYNAPSKPEKKVNLTTTVIVAAVTMAIGVIVGINFDKISNNINTALGNRAATSISFANGNTRTLREYFAFQFRAKHQFGVAVRSFNQIYSIVLDILQVANSLCCFC